MKRFALLLLLVLGAWMCASQTASARPYGWYGYGPRPYYRAYYGPRPIYPGPYFRPYPVYYPRVVVGAYPPVAPYYFGAPYGPYFGPYAYYGW